MNIIDFRYRPNTREILEGFFDVFGAFIQQDKGLTHDEYLAGAQTLDTIAEELKAGHMLRAVICGRDIETTFDVRSNNDQIAAFCAAHPELFVGFCGIDPHKGRLAVEEINTRVRKQGFCGVALDPMHARIPADDAKYLPIYETCAALDIPVVITGGPSRLIQGTVIEHGAPRYIDHVADLFPTLKIVISHGCWPFVTEAIGVVFRHENVFMELSEYETFPQANLYVEAANTIIGDKILFASAHPGVDWRDAVQLYEELPFHDKVREKVLWKNAAHVLGLE